MKATKSMRSEEVQKFIEEDIILKYRCPYAVVNNGATSMMSQEIRGFYGKHKIE